MQRSSTKETAIPALPAIPLTSVHTEQISGPKFGQLQNTHIVSLNHFMTRTTSRDWRRTANRSCGDGGGGSRTNMRLDGLACSRVTELYGSGTSANGAARKTRAVPSFLYPRGCFCSHPGEQGKRHGSIVLIGALCLENLEAHKRDGRKYIVCVAPAAFVCFYVPWSRELVRHWVD